MNIQSPKLWYADLGISCKIIVFIRDYIFSENNIE